MEISKSDFECLKEDLSICLPKQLKIRGKYTLRCGKEKIKVYCTQWWSMIGGAVKSSVIPL